MSVAQITDMFFCDRHCCGTGPDLPITEMSQLSVTEIPQLGRYKQYAVCNVDKCKTESAHVQLQITDAAHCVEDCTSKPNTSPLEAIARRNHDPTLRRGRKTDLNLQSVLLSPREKRAARAKFAGDTPARDSDDESSEYYFSPKWTRTFSRMLDDVTPGNIADKWYGEEDTVEEEKNHKAVVSSFAEDMMRGMWIEKLCANGNRLPRMCSLDRHLSSFIILLEGQLAEYPFSQMLEVCRGYVDGVFTHYMPAAQRARLPPPEVCATIMMASRDITFVLPSEPERDHFVSCMQTLRYQYLRRRKVKRSTTLY